MRIENSDANTAQWNAICKARFLQHMGLPRHTTLVRAAPGKINLGLQLLRRRSDGYHDLATVFYPLRWADTLSVRASSTFALTSTEPALDCGASNLVLRAARALAAETGTPRAARMALTKRLPMGAGLGGGSSDAAVALQLLSRLWNQPTSDAVLRRLALRLGSDVPFFLDPRPAYATGRGEVLAPMMNYALPFDLVVAVPPLHVSTAWAFRQAAPHAQGRPDLRAVVASNDLDRWRQALVNDFERTVFACHPRLKTLKAMLLDLGAGYASLTGTGAAVFAAFEQRRSAREAARAARAAGCTVHLERAA